MFAPQSTQCCTRNSVTNTNCLSVPSSINAGRNESGQMPARCLERMHAWSPRACGLLHGILRPGDSHSLVCKAGVCCCCCCWLVIGQQMWPCYGNSLVCRNVDILQDTQSRSVSRSDVRLLQVSEVVLVATKSRTLRTLNTTLSSSAAIAAADRFG